MRLTGLIYAAIAVAWLAYLIPTYARRHDQQTRTQIDPRRRFSDSVRILRSGAAPALDQDLAPIHEVEISTPLTRRSAVFELRRLELQAAGRRRRVLLILLAAITVVLGACLAELIAWSWLALPTGLLLAFGVVARFSVRSMRRGLDERYRSICEGGDEQTVTIRRSDLAAAVTVPAPEDAAKSESSKPLARGLWEPLPITLPTYVSKPLAPRTVRTIDLSAPDLSSSRSDVPVTADGFEMTVVRAAGAEQDEAADTGENRGEAASA